MGSLFRSEPMQLVQLFIQVEAAHATMEELGKLGVIQFKDLCADVHAFQRNFVNEIKRCSDLEQKIKFFEEILATEIEAIEAKGLEHEHLTTPVPEYEKSLNIDDMQGKFGELYQELTEVNSRLEILEKHHVELIELKHLLSKDAVLFEQAMGGAEGTNFDWPDDEDQQDDADDEHSVNAPLVSPAKRKVPLESKGHKAGAARGLDKTIGFLSGVLPDETYFSFERLLWRATRGNLYLRYTEIETKLHDAKSGQPIEKGAFVICYQGELAKAKILRVCNALGANMYTLPDSPKARQLLAADIDVKLKDHEQIVERTKQLRTRALLQIAPSLQAWKHKVLKEMGIYHTLNKFNYDIGRQCLIAEGWCPRDSTEAVVGALVTGCERSKAAVPSIMTLRETREDPPTFFRTNKFTSSFQGLVDAYGIAGYGEVNPAVFAIITFPFLFAVMFGDVGHGFIMLVVSALFVIFEEKLSKIQLNEMIKTCYDGRYMLLMMGAFSMFTGLIYNECFAVGLDIFGSQWEYPSWNSTEAVIKAGYENRPYPFGVDPAWQGASNQLTYFNSLKMKLSILLGVVHMCFGITLSLFNGIHFGHHIDIWCEFLPQMIFMLSIFGYLCALVVVKWLQAPDYGSHPMILQIMIQMFLSIGSVAPENSLYEHQNPVQLALIGAAVISIPWMLVSKPYILKAKHKSRMKAKAANPNAADDAHGSEEFDFGEIFIKQVIHTIEFVLGGISNTASYLRLWALSLAHSELSEVFMGRVLVGVGLGSSFIATFIAWAVWAGATVGILMIMESLSAFLHALRLHWVEFMNKFYHGDGYQFVPFSFELILAGTSEGEEQ